MCRYVYAVSRDEVLWAWVCRGESWLVRDESRCYVARVSETRCVATFAR